MPDRAPPSGGTSEDARVERLLADLLSLHGWTCFPTQGPWDGKRRNSGPAMAYGPEWWNVCCPPDELPVPALDAQTPEPASKRVGFLVQSTEPRRGGYFGLDSISFLRAEHWQERM